jgi:CMP-N,N'-diacetyllegionaminic acid synthase
MASTNERMSPRVLGVIPARGGSKGVPRKNIRLLGDKPLIVYTIEAALKSRAITYLVTSTDDDEIAEVAARHGSAVVKRPKELAEDETPMPPVVLHVLNAITHGGDAGYDIVALLQPTCPLRTPEDIDQAVQLLVESDCEAVISVYRVWDEHPARMYYVRHDRLVPYEAASESSNRQDLTPVYHRNGLLYVIRERVLREQGTFFPRDIRPYITPRMRSVNIDDEMDFLFADFLISRGSHKNT